MGNFETVRLGDVATYINGYAFKPSYWSDNGLPIIRIQNLTGNDYETNYYSGDYNKKYEVVNGDILISWSASLGVYEWKNEKALLNQHIFKVVFDKLPIDKSYFVHTVSYLLNDMLKETHGSTMKHITKPRFDNTAFPYPPLETQKQIADTLDKVTHTIDTCKAILEKLDLLVKSRFVEMFGDIDLNPFNWEKAPMGNYMSLLTDFSANGSYEYLDSNVIMYDEPNYALMVRTTDLEKNDFVNDVKYIDEKAYNILSKSKIFGNEIIMNKIGSAGKVYLMPILNKPVSLGRNAFMFRFNEEINIIFLYHLLISEYGAKEIQQHVRGAVTKTITKEAARSVRIIIPPLALQQQFAAFVEQTDKTKQQVKMVLEKAETLKKALMQEYFG